MGTDRFELVCDERVSTCRGRSTASNFVAEQLQCPFVAVTTAPDAITSTQSKLQVLFKFRALIGCARC